VKPLLILQHLKSLKFLFSWPDFRQFVRKERLEEARFLREWAIFKPS